MVSKFAVVSSFPHTRGGGALTKPGHGHARIYVRSGLARARLILASLEKSFEHHEPIEMTDKITIHLLHLYFLGDLGDARRTCPGDEEGWQEALRAQEEHVGLPAGHRLETRIHKLFLPIVL